MSQLEIPERMGQFLSTAQALLQEGWSMEDEGGAAVLRDEQALVVTDFSYEAISTKYLDCVVQLKDAVNGEGVYAPERRFRSGEQPGAIRVPEHTEDAHRYKKQG